MPLIRLPSTSELQKMSYVWLFASVYVLDVFGHNMALLGDGVGVKMKVVELGAVVIMIVLDVPVLSTDADEDTFKVDAEAVLE